jgi:hypothetical protein
MRHTDNGGRRSEAILAEIVRTRTDMDATLHAIERRLTPGQLMDQSLDYLRRSGGGEFISNLGTSVKRNPLPVALAGIGLAWLMALSRSAGDNAGPSATRRFSERASDTVSGASEAAASAKGRVDEATRVARERVSETMSRASDAVGSAKQRVGESAQLAREGANQLRESARHQMERARSGFDYLIQEQPLALAAVGLAVGAVLAGAAPRTRQEDALMGEARDQLAERTKDAGKEQLEKAQRVASAATEAATQEARSQDVPKGSQPAATDYPR